MRLVIGSAAALLTAARLGAQSNGPAIQAHLFADFNYTDTQRPIAEGFRLGQLAGHLAWAMSDRATVFSEASATGGATTENVEIERLFVRYDVRDWLKLSVGRVHTPIAYWNNAFHHGQWMQTTIGRPEMVRGGSPLIPIHFVGVTAEGTRPAGPAVLGYEVGVGNGRGAVLTRAGDNGDANNSRAFVAQAFTRLPRLYDARVGGAIYSDRLTPNAGTDVRERIVSGHVALERETPEVLFEYARVRHDPSRPAGVRSTSATWYGQLGYRLPGKASAFKPYTRFDHSTVPQTDTILAPLKLNFDGMTYGLRYDPLANGAIKLEYRGERLERGPRLRTIAISFSFMLSGSSGDHHPEDPPIADAAPEARDHGAHTSGGKTP